MWAFGYKGDSIRGNASDAIGSMTQSFLSSVNSGSYLWDATNDRFKYNDDVLIDGLFTTTEGRILNTTRITSAASPYTVLSTDHEIFVNTDSANVTVNLPAGVEGTTYRIINSGTSGNTVSINPNGSENLIGANSAYTLLDGTTLIITSNATDGWY